MSAEDAEDKAPVGVVLDKGIMWGPREAVEAFTKPNHDPNLCPFCRAGVPLATPKRKP